MAGVEPSLLNPTTIIVAQVDEASTQYDPIRRTPVNRVARQTSFSVQAQIKWAVSIARNDPMASQAGVDEQQESYAVLLKKDVDALGKVIKRGDLIKQIEDLPTDLYVMRVEYGAHYDGGFKLIKVTFADRTSHDG